MRIYSAVWTASFLLMAAVGGAPAQMLVDPSGRAAQGGWQAGGSYQDFEANYTVDTVYEKYSTPDLSRTVASLYAAYGVLPKLDVFLAAGLTDDLDNSDHPEIEGDGNVFGAGARGRLWEANGFGVSAYGQIARLDENSSEERGASSSIGQPHVNERDTEFTVLLVGALATYSIEGLTLYAGPEVLAYQDGEYSYKTTLDDGSFYDKGTLDIERSDEFGLRAGARYNFASLWAWAGFASGHEDSWMLGVGGDF